jgi:hypothetical protein
MKTMNSPEKFPLEKHGDNQPKIYRGYPSIKTEKN